MSGFQVLKERCDQCLFGQNRVVSLLRMRQILRKCEREDRHFCCHRAAIAGQDACCRGFYDKDPHATNLMRVAERLGVIEFVTFNEEE